ncbi:MAG TPA: alpha/beta fold hydrolase [Mycobacteriales bacterium]|nr:alpha/beta fold hydrolase [Mycobacteriales bacterium]
MTDFHPLPGTDVVVGGIRLHVTAHGPAPVPGGPLPLLLLHGLPTCSYLWRDVMRDVGHYRHTVAPDLVGLGRSERPREREPYRLHLQAERLAGLLDALGIDRVAVAGHDLGGAVAVHLAALVPDRVAALILLDAPIHADSWPVPAVLPLLVPGGGEAYVTALRHAPALARALLARVLGAGAAHREIEGYLRPLLTADGGRGLLRFARAVDLAATEAAWRGLAAAPPPTLVLWGERDGLHPASYGQRVVRGMPGAVWAPVADAGHLLPQQRPERVAEELSGFLADAVDGAHLAG